MSRSFREPSFTGNSAPVLLYRQSLIRHIAAALIPEKGLLESRRALARRTSMLRTLFRISKTFKQTLRTLKGLSYTAPATFASFIRTVASQ